MIDPRIPLMIQQPNILAALDAGNTVASNQQNLLRQAEGQNLFREYGAEAMQGDQNALAQIGGFDPVMGQNMQAGQLNMQATRQNMAFDREKMQMLRNETKQALAASQDQAAALAEAQEVDRLGRAAVAAAARGDSATFGQITAEIFGQPLPLGEEGIAALSGVYGGAKDFLDAMPKEMTPDQRYKIVGGQLVDMMAQGGPAAVPGVDGRSAGMAVSVSPDGTVRFTQGGPAVLDQAPLKAGSGQARVVDPNSPTGTRQIAEPGSEAAAAEEASRRANAAAAENARTRTEVVASTTNGIRDLLKDKGFWSRIVTADLPEAGIFGERAQGISQEARDLSERISTLQGMVAFDRLEKMKAASATGASGLGQVTEREIALLAAQLGALSPGASREVILETLDTVERVFGKLSPEAQAYLLGTSTAEPWSQGGAAPITPSVPVNPATLPMRWRFNPETGDFE
jgi:hypothetical protein